MSLSNVQGSLVSPSNLEELELFREQWQAELRRRPAERLALTSRCAQAGALQSESHDISKPIVAFFTLPDDVLCEIFHAVAALEPPQSMEKDNSHVDPYTDPEFRPYSWLGWMRLTHVCQRWRDLLLFGAGMGRLWGRVAFKFPSNDAFPTLFARSGNALVDTLIQAPAALNPLRVQAAVSSLSRSHSLKIRTLASNGPSSFFADPLYLPSLRELDLTLEYGFSLALHSPRLFALSRVSAGPPPSDISIDGPNVQTASIEFTGMRTSGPSLPSLHFSLPSLRQLNVRISDHSTQSSNLRWLISLLRTSPLLETLSTDISIRDYAPDWNALLTETPVQLPQLMRLDLKNCDSVNLAPLIAHACANPPTYMSVTCNIAEQAATVTTIPQSTTTFIHGFGIYLCRPGHRALFFSVELPYTSSRRPSRHGCGVVAQSLPVLEDPISVINFSPHSNNDNMQDEEPMFRSLADTVKLSFEVPTHSSDGHAWLEALAVRIPNKELVEQLYLRVPTETLSSNGLMEIGRQQLFLPMIALRTLHILQPLRSIANAATWQETIDILRPSSPLIFPVLHTLIVPFFAETLRPQAHGEGMLGEWWNPLIHVLTQRHAHGSPVHTLRIVGRRSFPWLSRSMHAIYEGLKSRAMGVVTCVVDARAESDWNDSDEDGPVWAADDWPRDDWVADDYQ